MIFIACDIGNPGALAALDSEGHLVMVRELPLVSHQGVIWVDGLALTAMLCETFTDWPVRLTVELAHSVPVDGLDRTLTAGAMLGSILATAQKIGNGVGTRIIAPDSWRPRLGIDHSKAAALELARRLFPGGKAKISDDAASKGFAIQARCTALLMAEASRREYQEELVETRRPADGVTHD